MIGNPKSLSALAYRIPPARVIASLLCAPTGPYGLTLMFSFPLVNGNN
jgi:hypothetical protein